MKKKPTLTKAERKEKAVGTPRQLVSKEPSREAVNLREGPGGSGFTMLIYRRAIRRLQKAHQLNLFYRRMDELKLERTKHFVACDKNPDEDVMMQVTGFDYYLICKFAEEFKLKEQKVYDVVQ